MTTNFLFWNTNGNPVQNIISNLIVNHQIDILMLAEWSDSPTSIVTLLETRGIPFFEATQSIHSNCERITIFTRFEPEAIRPVAESDKLSIRRLTLPEFPEILLGVAHFRSQLYSSDAIEDLARQARNTAQTVAEQENKFSHTRTLFVGDFNMDPFDKGMIQPDGFNAVMTTHIAEREIQILDDREYRFFYNPMWGHFGDRSSGPPGTYYYRQKWPYWHIFDQVLIRPVLSSALIDLEILTGDGAQSFLTQNGIPEVSISDHLPLKFSLALEEQHV
ncbi:MAG: endonuclease/exonuclease/phosphatase family protein [Anaerolineae bacterium]|nr:endonuclease/exonuclease/phosphatase family protein [Anaerolineae bacterium]